MSKRKRKYRKERINNRQETQRQEPKELSKFRDTISRIWKKTIGILFLVAALGGIAEFWFSVSPRVSVSFSFVPVNPSDPFSIPFILSNDGYFSIKDIRVFCGLFSVETANGAKVISASRLNPGRLGDEFIMRKLNAGEKTMAFCIFSRVFHTTPITDADISIIVSFRPAFLLWTKEAAFRFVTQKYSDGTLRWLPQSLSK